MQCQSLDVSLDAGQCHRNSEDEVSDCSTMLGNQDWDDHLSQCSNSGLEVDTLIIIDWDDTLFPTTWLAENDLFASEANITSEQEKKLMEMSHYSGLTLQTALQLGKVVIITNAEEGWIEMSCTRFMPSLTSLLQRVDIVSARSSYEQFSQDASEWKRLAFEQEIGRFYSSAHRSEWRNVLSVGDSLHELTALKTVTKDVPRCRGKSVKLLDGPTIEQLMEQNEVLSSNLLDIAEHNGDLDIEIGAVGSS